MVSDKYDRSDARKGSLHGSFAGLHGMSGRVRPSSGVGLERSTALQRC
jgi:hypothetical protein